MPRRLLLFDSDTRFEMFSVRIEHQSAIAAGAREQEPARKT